jgi:phytoene dehydrogenase-like protein
MSGPTKQSRYDVVVVGGGHNGLVAAAYLARAGLSVLVLERLATTGGAATSEQPFAGLPARVSSHASLVGPLPDRIVEDLDLEVRLRPRRTSAYAPVVRNGRHAGLLVEREPTQATADSFAALTGSSREYDAWLAFRGRLDEAARVVAPSLLEPLPTRLAMSGRLGPETWRMLAEEPIGATIEKQFFDDTVRGLVAADAVLGTFADLRGADLEQNRTFLLHAVANGAREWRVPLGGMGVLSAAIEGAVWRRGGEVLPRAFVTRVQADGVRARVGFQCDGEEASVDCSWVLGNVAPWVLRLLLGQHPGPRPEGSLLAVTMLLDRLPRLRAGTSPPSAFAGTVHVDQGYDQLQEAYAEAQQGFIPARPPGRLVCTSLTDPSVLGTLALEGKHVVNYLGVHAPARLYSGNLEEQRDETVLRVLDGVNAHLEAPLESLLSLDKEGVPCLRAHAPQDVESALAIPGGHMYHGGLSWPWLPDDAPVDTAAQRWGVDTPVPNVLLCGSGARRGGAVSGLGGHNAAMAVLESLDGRSPHP